MQARVMKVIQVVYNRGRGLVKEDPIRNVTTYFTLKGDFLAEHDPCKPVGPWVCPECNEVYVDRDEALTCCSEEPV